MDDSIYFFNLEKYCFLSMFLEVVYWKLVIFNKMNFVYVRKNVYFFVNRFFLNLFYVIYIEKKIIRKVLEGMFWEYILFRVRKS